MRIRATAVVCLVLTLGTALVMIGPGAQAQCVAPDVDVTPNRGLQGSKITITGGSYWDRCNDFIICHIFTPTPSPDPTATFTPTPEPTQTCETPDPARPIQNIRLIFVQPGHVWRLGTVDADSKGRINLIAGVPEDADLGAAEIRACLGGPGCTFPTTDFRVGRLAETGFATEVKPVLAVGTGSTLAGLALLALARRRRSRAA